MHVQQAEGKAGTACKSAVLQLVCAAKASPAGSAALARMHQSLLYAAPGGHAGLRFVQLQPLTAQYMLLHMQVTASQVQAAVYVGLAGSGGAALATGAYSADDSRVLE